MGLWWGVPIGVQFLLIESIVIAFLVTVLHENAFNGSDSQMGEAKRSKGNMVVYDFRLIRNYAFLNEGLGDFFNIGDLIFVGFKESV